MNKIQFNELLAYLRNRPSEREKLRMVLMGESELQADPQQQNLREADQWLTARKVGEQIGMSAKWVKERLQSLPAGTYERRGNRGTWWINATVNINQLTQMRAYQNHNQKQTKTTMSKHTRLQKQSYELKYQQRDMHLTQFDFKAADDAEEEFQVIDPDTVDNNPVNLAYEPLVKRTDYDQKGNLKPIIPDWECVAHRAAEFIKNI